MTKKKQSSQDVEGVISVLDSLLTANNKNVKFATALKNILIQQNTLVTRQEERKHYLIQAQKHLHHIDDEKKVIHGEPPSNLTDTDSSINPQPKNDPTPIDYSDANIKSGQYAYLALAQALAAVNKKITAESEKKSGNNNVLESLVHHRFIILYGLAALIGYSVNQPADLIGQESTLLALNKAQFDMVATDERTQIIQAELPVLFESLCDAAIQGENEQMDMLGTAIAHYNVRKKFSKHNQREMVHIANAQQLPQAIQSLDAKLTLTEDEQFAIFKRTFEDVLFHAASSFKKDLFNGVAKSLLEVDFRAMGDDAIDPDLHAILISFIRNDVKGNRVGSTLVNELYQEFFNHKTAGNIKDVWHCIGKIMMLAHKHEHAATIQEHKNQKDYKAHKLPFARDLNRLSERYNYKFQFKVIDDNLVVVPREEVTRQKVTERNRKPHIKRITHIISLCVGLGAGILTIGAMLGGFLPLAVILGVGIAGAYVNYILFNSFAVPFFVRVFNKGIFTKEGVLRNIANQFRGDVSIWKKILLGLGYSVLAIFIISLPVIMFAATVFASIASFGTILPMIIGAISVSLPILISPLGLEIIKGLAIIATYAMAGTTFLLYLPITIFCLVEFPATVQKLWGKCREIIQLSSSPVGKVLLGIAIAIPLILAILGVLIASVTTIRYFGEATMRIISKWFPTAPAAGIAIAGSGLSAAGQIAMNQASLFSLFGSALDFVKSRYHSIRNRFNPPEVLDESAANDTAQKEQEIISPWAQDGTERITNTLMSIFNLGAVLANGTGNGFIAAAGATTPIGRIIAWATGTLTSMGCGMLGMNQAAACAQAQEPVIKLEDEVILPIGNELVSEASEEKPEIPMLGLLRKQKKLDSYHALSHNNVVAFFSPEQIGEAEDDAAPNYATLSLSSKRNR